MHSTTNVEINAPDLRPDRHNRATGSTGGVESARLAREAERLYGLSGSQLARLGLSRDRIFAHVYGGAN